MSDATGFKETFILITGDGMGRADDPELRRHVLGKYLTLLLENGDLPGAIGMYTDGVKMGVDGSPVLDQLKALEDQGVRVLTCNTCLEHFGLRDRVAVGVIGGMGDILVAQSLASKVITI